MARHVAWRGAVWMDERGDLGQCGGCCIAPATSAAAYQAADWCTRIRGLIGRGWEKIYDRTRAIRTTASTKNIPFMDHAATSCDTMSLPPIAFMIWMPVR